MTRHLIYETDEVWLYDVRDGGVSVGYDFGPVEGNENYQTLYADADDLRQEFYDWCQAVQDGE